MKRNRDSISTIELSQEFQSNECHTEDQGSCFPCSFRAHSLFGFVLIPGRSGQPTLRGGHVGNGCDRTWDIPCIFTYLQGIWSRRVRSRLHPPDGRQDFLIPRAGNQILSSRAGAQSFRFEIWRPKLPPCHNAKEVDARYVPPRKVPLLYRCVRAAHGLCRLLFRLVLHCLPKTLLTRLPVVFSRSAKRFGISVMSEIAVTQQGRLMLRSEVEDNHYGGVVVRSKRNTPDYRGRKLFQISSRQGYWLGSQSKCLLFGRLTFGLVRRWGSLRQEESNGWFLLRRDRTCSVASTFDRDPWYAWFCGRACSARSSGCARSPRLLWLVRHGP
jgi:hypothetical protein